MMEIENLKSRKESVLKLIDEVENRVNAINESREMVFYTFPNVGKTTTKYLIDLIEGENNAS